MRSCCIVYFFFSYLQQVPGAFPRGLGPPGVTSVAPKREKNERERREKEKRGKGKKEKRGQKKEKDREVNQHQSCELTSKITYFASLLRGQQTPLSPQVPLFMLVLNLGAPSQKIMDSPPAFQVQAGAEGKKTSGAQN